MPDQQVTDSVFPDEVFAQPGCVQFKQGDWLGQKEFIDELRRSWVAQYTDYLGADIASKLVQQLIDDGSLFKHDERATLQAWSGGELVGITSLRQLDGLSMITLLEVHSRYQKQGIGRLLLQALETASPRLLAHVSIHRPHLKMFYNRCGYVELQPTVIDHYGHQLAFDVMVRSHLLD